MSLESLEQFRQRFLEDQALQSQLQEASDLGNLVDLAVRLGRENGYDFTAEEVRQTIQAEYGEREVSSPISNILDPSVQGY
jgi:predicted ribosomally synthesized peptide with nif11-like leader